MKKVLVATHSDIRSASIKDILNEEWCVYVCHDGYEVADVMKYIQPEAMILELNMPGKDGITILQESFPNTPPATLALSSLITDYVTQTCLSLGISYLMPATSRTQDICDRLNEIYAALQEPPTATMQHLRVLGVKSHLDGYSYLMIAVPYFAENSNSRMKKEIYAYIVEQCGVNDVQCVERSIRGAIQDAWEHRNSAVWAQYFPGSDKAGAECPSNKVFISALSERI